MTSIICPVCKSHVSEWDVTCLNCGHSVTPEERKRLLREQEELQAREHSEKMAAHHRLNNHRHSFQVRMDRFSIGLLHLNLDVVFVFLVSILLAALVVVLMLL